jgi:hypothetical protein
MSAFNFASASVKLDDLERLCDDADAAGRDTIQLVVPAIPTGERIRLLGTLGPLCEEIACVTDKGTVAWWKVAKIRALVARARKSLGEAPSPDGARASSASARCKGCDAAIVWVKTPGGRNMACNPEIIDFWKVDGGHERIVTEQGAVLAGSSRQPGLFSPVPLRGRIPHWSACPDAANFRGRK